MKRHIVYINIHSLYRILNACYITFSAEPKKDASNDDTKNANKTNSNTTTNKPDDKVKNKKKESSSSVAINMSKLPEDPETKLAKAIIDGQDETVIEILKKFKPNENCVLREIDVSKLHSDNDLMDHVPDGLLHPLDLAAFLDQLSILDQILDYALGMQILLEQLLPFSNGIIQN